MPAHAKGTYVGTKSMTWKCIYQNLSLLSNLKYWWPLLCMNWLKMLPCVLEEESSSTIKICNLGSIQQPVVAKNESPAGLAPGQQGWQTTTKCWETSSIVVRSSHSFPSKVYCGDSDGIEASMTVVAVISIVNPDLAPGHKTWVWHKSPFDNLKSYNLFSALGLGQWRDMTQECARQ